MAGMIAAFISSMTQVLLTLAMGRSIEENLNEAIDRAGQFMPNATEASQIVANIPGPVFIALTTILSIVIYAPFGALGGVIGRALFEKRAMPPVGTPGESAMPPGPPPTLDI